MSLNVNLFSEETKNICICTAVSIMIIFMFVISPLSNFFKTSFIMKAISLRLMIYILYLSYNQIETLRNAYSTYLGSNQIQAQLNTNIMVGYIYLLFIGLLVIFVFKSMMIDVMSFFKSR
jgi:hypothetical protein